MEGGLTRKKAADKQVSFMPNAKHITNGKGIYYALRSVGKA
jgi:hypothetical protein